MIIEMSEKMQKYLTDPPGGELGLVLKPDAPDDVKEEFKRHREIFRAYIAESNPNELKELKWLHDD